MIIISIILALILGILVGIFTGLIPGLHINLVAMLLFLFSSKLESDLSLILASFIVAMSVTHIFLDFIPSIFLGAPTPQTALSILPGHRLLLKGKGYELSLIHI